MSYVSKSLGADESVIVIARFPWPYHLVAWTALITLGIIGVGVVIFILMLVHFKTTEAALTTRRVVYKRGLFTRRTMELGLSSIEQVELKQGFWGRIFGFGQIVVSGTGEGQIVTHPMADPLRFRRSITDARADAGEVRIASEDLSRLAARTRPLAARPRGVVSIRGAAPEPGDGLLYASRRAV